MDFNDARREMVDCQIRTADVTNYSIIKAVLSTPKERFVPKNLESVAYSGSDLLIGRDRFILEPRTFAKMLELLDVTDKDLVLDIGPGYGYSTAVLACLAEAVVGIEEDFYAEKAQNNLSEQAIHNAIIYKGKLQDGSPNKDKVDALIIQGGVETIPFCLSDQVKIGGKIVAIFLDGARGECRLGSKTDLGVNWNFGFNALAPLLVQFQNEKKFVF